MLSLLFLFCFADLTKHSFDRISIVTGGGVCCDIVTEQIFRV
jgi:hypothetical protein